MKKNQSLLRGIKVLGGTFLVYLLGLGCGNFAQNHKPLLVESASSTGFSVSIAGCSSTNVIAT